MSSDFLCKKELYLYFEIEEEINYCEDISTFFLPMNVGSSLVTDLLLDWFRFMCLYVKLSLDILA